MNFINELVYYLTGGHNLAFEIAAFFFVLFGVCINVLYTITTRNVCSTNCPVKCRVATSDCQEKLCKRYFWRNNKWRLAVNFLNRRQKRGCSSKLPTFSRAAKSENRLQNELNVLIAIHRFSFCPQQSLMSQNNDPRRQRIRI